MADDSQLDPQEHVDGNDSAENQHDNKEVLISFVKENECLWNVKHKLYLDRDRKSSLFEEIGRRIGIDDHGNYTRSKGLAIFSISMKMSI